MIESTHPSVRRSASSVSLLLVALLGCSSTSTTPPPGRGARPAPPATAPGGGAPPAPPVRTDTEPGPVPAAGAPLVRPAAPAPFGVDLDTVRAGEFDQGRMWTFDVPPAEHFASSYGIDADSAWFARARLGALRIPSCSASFVSPHGLVMTNHHCARDFVSQVSEEGENLLDDGFYARSLAEERPVEDFEADQLVAIVDVTAEIDDAVGDRRGGERSARIEEKSEEIVERLLEERGGEDAGYKVEIVSLYNGGRHSAYVFRSYTDVKLVMAPELQIGFFGGDPDNFTYPRYNLDFAFFRVYDGDAPLQTDEYFPLSTEGVSEGDPVFIVGNPGSTSRLQTVAELVFRRDVSDRAVLTFLEDRAEVFEEYIESWPDEAEEYDLRNVLFGILNSQKAYTGQLEGLADPVILARRTDTEQAFQAAIEADPMLAEEYGSLIAEMAEIQASKRAAADGFGAFLALSVDDYASPTLHRALIAFQIVNMRQQGAPETATADLMEQLMAVTNKPTTLDQMLVEARIRDFISAYGEDTRWLLTLLGGRTPEGAAAVVVEGSMLADSASAVEAVRTGTLDVNDPAMRFVGAYVPAFVRFQQVVGEAGQRESEIAARLGRARYAVYGTDVPPDATFSLRIADGVVQGYPYNGTRAPSVTTFFGMYDRHHAFAPEYAESPEDSPWALPDRWATPPSGLDLSTPVNFVSTVDIIGGNSGSPVLNADLEVVGVVFDGNIESLPGDYIFLPEFNRSVTVDARAILEALEHAWQMPELVRELTEGARVPAGS
ncbi:S46 family peptidase [Gemmatimonadota bacterium Y43]|uniref:S46 family peptidase n=1 Tax=Gaopeijia maritima TaxID=3119007 RepID=UPI0032935DA9